MSHISIYEYKITNINILKSLCEKNNIPYELAKEGETIKKLMYGSQTATGIMSFNLEGWRYPCVVAADGSINYDAYGSESGTKQNFNNLIQEYNHETVKANIDYSLFDNVTTIINDNGDIIIEMIEY